MLESVVGCEVPMLALVWSTLGRTVENAAVRWSRVLMSVVLACPMGMATNSTRPQCCLRAATGGVYFSVFSVCFFSHPRSRESAVYDFPHRMCAHANLYVFQDEAAI